MKLADYPLPVGSRVESPLFKKTQKSTMAKEINEDDSPTRETPMTGLSI